MTRQHSAIVCALLSLACVLLCSGCVAPPEPIAPDPWSPTPSAAPYDPACPGGQCPTPAGDSLGIEISSGGLLGLNASATLETKSGPCPCGDSCPCGDACQCGPDCECGTREQCVPCQPATKPASKPPTTKPDTANETKTGAFACERCKRPTVGLDWAEIWADDGTSLLCLCRNCFDRASPAEREHYLKSFAARSGIDLQTRPAVAQAIADVSQRGL